MQTKKSNALNAQYRKCVRWRGNAGTLIHLFFFIFNIERKKKCNSYKSCLSFEIEKRCGTTLLYIAHHIKMISIKSLQQTGHFFRSLVRLFVCLCYKTVKVRFCSEMVSHEYGLLIFNQFIFVDIKSKCIISMEKKLHIEKERGRQEKHLTHCFVSESIVRSSYFTFFLFTIFDVEIKN